jgi:L-ribulose-5-phosphate 4-epimerase
VHSLPGQHADEGATRFTCEWSSAPPPARRHVEALNAWRRRLFGLQLVGAYENGTGFGNLSVRVEDSECAFVITATNTGHLPELESDHYVLVTAVDLENGRVKCQGPARASSESMTHYALYVCSDDTTAVIHVHHARLWRNLYGKVPTTSPEAACGTKAIASEVERLFAVGDLGSEGLLVMGGHPDGLISFGATLDVAGERVLRAYRETAAR